jgi:hypothetical protein
MLVVHLSARHVDRDIATEEDVAHALVMCRHFGFLPQEG